MKPTRYDMFLFAMVALALGQSILPKMAGSLEGEYFPVVEIAEIDISEKVDDDPSITRFGGTSVKIRDCDFNRVFWRLGAPGSRQTPAQLTILENDKIREEGDFSFGPWITRMTPADLIYNSEGFVVHDCHPFWHTISKFYAPPTE